MAKALQKRYDFSYLRALIFAGIMVTCFLEPSYAQTVFYQNFDGAYTNTKINAGGSTITNASCIPTSQTWTGGTSCSSCYGGGTNCYYFYRDDQSISSGVDMCGGAAPATPCTDAGAYSIYFDCYDAQNSATVTSPTIDLSAYASSCYTVTLKFYYYNFDETSVQASLYNGSSWLNETALSGTSGNWQTKSYTIPIAYCVSNFQVMFTGNSAFQSYPIGFDEVSISVTSTAPTLQASAITYSGVTCNSMTVNWTNGNGSNRIVVAYPNSTITNPSSGTAYTANNTYGSGTGLGAGFVVYNGTGSSVNVSGLSASTTYYFAVFDYNAPTCYITPGVSSSQATPACAACPTTAASALSYSGVTCSSVTVNWTNGNGTNRIVVAYPNNTLTNPVNTTAYTANTTYGSGTALGAGFVVYNGTGSTVTVSGLAASTTYWFAVFEYNTVACYYTTGAPHTSQATPSCAACPTTAASALSFSSISCSGMTVSWTNGNGADRVVVAYPNSTITNPVNSTAYTANTTYGSGTALGAGFVIYNGTGSTVNVSGLTAGVTYYFAVFEYNTTACYLTPGLSSNQATATTPTTSSSAITYPGISCSDILLNWTTGNGTNRIVVAYPNSTITPPVSGTAYTANSAYGSGAVLGVGSVVYNGTGNSVDVTGLTAGTTYWFAVFEYNGTSCYLTPGVSSSQAVAASPTTSASAISYSAVACTGMTVSWTNGNGGKRIVVAYPNSTITNPTSGTTYAASTTYGSGTALGAGFVIYNGSGSSVAVSGLTSNTTYYFAVFEYNGTSCYKTPGVSSNNTTSTCAGCPTTNSSALSYSHVGCNSITLGWTNGNGTRRIVVVYPNSTITNPTNGTTYTASYTYGSGTAVGAGYIVYNGTGSSVTVLGLSASTTYYFAVFEYTTVACYLNPGASSNKSTTACTNCPFMSIAETDGCNGNVGCNEGDTEWLLFNTCSYGWDNSVDPPTVNYGSNPAPAWTHSTNSYTSDPTTTATMNTDAGCTVFIDASAGGVVIPPWSNVLYCAVGTAGSNSWCPDGYTWTGLCAYAPIYVIYGTNGLISSGNYLDHTSPLGTLRYFEVVFPIGGSCDEFYQYDADLESNGNIDGHSGDGANELFTAAGISTSSASPEDVTNYGQSCTFSLAAALPIKLTSFTALPDNNVVKLTWQTATEINNKLFTIEKTTDGVEWKQVTTVPGAGNSDHTINYSAIDESPYPNTSYYRLKQTDIDGHSSYSNVEAVSFAPAENTMTLVPNPASNTTSVTFSSQSEGGAILTISDLTGRVIDTRQLNVMKGNNTVMLNITNYANGLYFITINTAMQQLSSKLVVSHN